MPKKTQATGSAREPAGNRKNGSAKAKKQDAAGKGKKTVVIAKKASHATMKSARFEKDDDFVPNEEEGDVADDEGAEDSDFNTDVAKVILFLCTLFVICTSLLY